MAEYKNNCFSYTYFEMKLLPEEVLLPFISLRRIRENFDQVQSVEEADALAIIIPFARGLIASHMAVINDDKRTLRHRRGTDEPVVEGEIEKEIAPYLQEELAERIWLKLKPGTKASF